MDDISRLQRDRNRVLGTMGLIFVIWQCASLARDIIALAVPDLREPAIIYADWAEDIGAILWVFATLWLVVLMRRVKRTQAGDVLQDELFRHTQSRALRAGYKAMVGLLVVLVGLEVFFDLTAGIAIRAMMLVAVAAPITAFLVYWPGGEDEA